MVKKFKEFLEIDVSADGFSLLPRDAYDTAKNIDRIFVMRCGFFSLPKPMHILDLKAAYKQLVPQMEIHFPGVIDKIFHPVIITKLGFHVDPAGMVHWSR